LITLYNFNISIWKLLGHFRQNGSEIAGNLLNVLLEKDREIGWSDRVKNEGMYRVREKSNILCAKQKEA
jgi:hypothetical protein